MLTISIVTHKQLKIMRSLLQNIFDHTDFYLIITINTKEDETVLSNYPSNRFSIVRNQKPLGFTENHNNAFKLCNTDYFLILNPDVIIENNLINNILSEMIKNNLSVLSPIAKSSNGKILDNGRRYPKFFTPILRLISNRYKIDYEFTEKNNYRVDWISGMFIMIKSNVFLSLKGFDEQFFLYYDDVDLCRRANDSGYDVYLTNKYSVVHEGNRLSKKSLKYFLIHLSSLFKYHLKHGL
ncbi:MAG: glycosyltransferase [Pseudomonadota bacterium]|nr:glycosyltransferase [Pseudomonadota bacterium]